LLTGENETGESDAVVAFVAGCDRLGSTKPKEPFMTKKEIAKKISEQSGITHVLALEAVQLVFDGITKTLVDEGRIEPLPQSTQVPAFRW
jgi:hypothetical protein